MTVTTATAARLAHITARTIRAWCRRGLLAAAKLHGRWTIAVADLRALLAQLYPAPRPRPAGRHRKGEAVPVKTGRAARARVGHHMSVQRRTAVLDALVQRTNAGYMTAVEYLTGIGFPEAERYASAFGRATAAAYRKSHNTEPYNGCLVVVRGCIHQVFGYVDVADLYAGAYSYARTREHLNAQRTPALRELIAA